MKKIKYFLSLCVIGCLAVSCVDLNVAPVNIVQDPDVFKTDNGILSYRSHMYSGLPIEDHRYAPFNRMFNDFYIIKPLSAVSGEAFCRDQTGAATENCSNGGDVTNPDNAEAFFRNTYGEIRDINYFLQMLPQYASNFSDAKVKHWMGEAYFLRAVSHFALVKRFGGVPYIKEVLNYPQNTIDQLNLPRQSEEYCYDQMALDLDSAYILMGRYSLDKNNSEIKTATFANKYVAAAFKSRIMLFAGCVAKYNNFNYTDRNNVQICGIPQVRAKDYFQKAYDAAKLVDNSGDYSLYMKNWKDGDKEAQYQNMVNMFFDTSSPENLFIRQYQYPNSVHGYDSYFVPRQLMGGSGYSSSNNPTLDFVEMYDGFPKNTDGTLKNLDSSGNYAMYSNTMDLFANAEPRLRATVLLPGDIMKGQTISIYRGLYTGSAASGINPSQLRDNLTAPYKMDNLLTEDPSKKVYYTFPDGTKMEVAGQSGIFNTDRTCAVGGFSVRKYIDPDRPTDKVLENYSDQPYLEMRYAEVLLNRAEADCELADLGAGGDLTDAYNCINQVRTRAGATLLTSSSQLSDINIVRTERRKELGFENKTYWDLRRWRILDKEQNARQYRELVPFFSTEAKKYFFDVRPNEYGWIQTFDTRWYYQRIPQGEIDASKQVLTQNPGY